MQRPPRPPDESIFAHGLWQHVVWVGLLMAALTLAHAGLGDRARVGALADHGVHRADALAARPRAGDPLRARVAVHAGLRSNLPLLGAVLLTSRCSSRRSTCRRCNAIFKTAAADRRRARALLAAVRAWCSSPSRSRSGWCGAGCSTAHPWQNARREHAPTRPLRGRADCAKNKRARARAAPWRRGCSSAARWCSR